MKKLFVFAACLLMAVVTFAQNGGKDEGGVLWENGTFQEALNKAKSDKKGRNFVFMDCYTTWCGPCKWMSTQVFPTKEAGDYFNKNFINLKMDMEKGEGPDLLKKLDINVFPTFLVLTPEGKEVGRIIGSDSLKSFVSRIENAKDIRNSPTFLLNKYENTKDVNDAVAYLDAASKQMMDAQIVDFFNKHYDEMDERAKYDRKINEYLPKAISLTEPHIFNEMMDHKSDLDEVLGKGTADEAVASSLCDALGNYLFTEGQNVTSETANRASEALSLLSRTAYDQLISRASKAMAKNDTTALVEAFREGMIAYQLIPVEMSTAEGLFLHFKNVSNKDKIKFEENYKQIAGYSVSEIDEHLKSLQGDKGEQK